MPTSTFYRLPGEKRAKILRAAVGEFSRKPYGEVSINRVIQAAEIPRGSFYQYFADKTDLFRCVLCRYGEGLENMILESLDASGGDLLELPLTLFDRIVARVQADGAEFRVILAILRQNAGLDVGQIWDFMAMAQTVLERANVRNLAIAGREEEIALLDLLLCSSAQAFAAVCCGKLTEQESRRRLACKTALLRRGVEKQEES